MSNAIFNACYRCWFMDADLSSIIAKCFYFKILKVLLQESLEFIDLNWSNLGWKNYW